MEKIPLQRRKRPQRRHDRRPGTTEVARPSGDHRGGSAVVRGPQRRHDGRPGTTEAARLPSGVSGAG